MFTKKEIKNRYNKLKKEAFANGTPPLEAALDLATLILTCALYGKKLHSGEDYSAHPMHVAMAGEESKNKRIIAILHDVLEDNPDWTVNDLRELGFSERILKGVDGVTKRPGEKYFDFIVRCGMSGQDAIDVKIADIHHNSDNTRYRHVGMSRKKLMKQDVYNIAYHYLVDIKKGQADPKAGYNTIGTSIVDYIKSRKEFAGNPEVINALLDEYSSEAERLPMAPSLGQTFNAAPN